MLSGTTLTALRTLLYLAERAPAVLPPKRIAEDLGESPSYLAKVATQLVKANILKADKGVKGGVHLARPAAGISMLAVVEACQGALVGAYCRSPIPTEEVCAFHTAARQLERAIALTLTRWTLADLIQKPRRQGSAVGGFSCIMLAPNEARESKKEAEA